MKQLSIIIPVYNVEKYIHMCLESIFRQSIDDDTFEVILVNDGTPDRSMEVIADIVETHQNIHIINQENQGLSVARNNGMQIASGKYILFIDSDDLLIDNSVPYLLEKAVSSKVDLVVADFIKMYDEEIAHLENKNFIRRNGRTIEKTGIELFLQDLNPHYCHVWRTMYRRNFLNNNNLRFIPHICFEDIPFTQQCYLKANLSLRVNWDFIIYRKGHTSITSSFNLKKAKDFCTAISETWKMSNKDNLDYHIKTKLRNNAFVHFSLLLYSLTSCDSIPRTEKMSILYYLKKTTPDLTFKNGIKQRIVDLFYQRMPSTYMILRIIYANYFQYLFWAIGDFIRGKKNK